MPHWVNEMCSPWWGKGGDGGERSGRGEGNFGEVGGWGDEKEADGGFIHLLSTPLMGSQQLSSLISKFIFYTAAYRGGAGGGE